MDIALYLRKSRADIEAERLGELETLSRHRKTLMEIAEKEHHNVVAVREEIVSAERISDRPEVQRLLQEVRNGMYDAVLCMDIDRLGRGDMRDQGEIISTFQESGTLIITPSKTYDLEDEHDETWSEFEAFMARQEYKMIKRRLLRGKKRSAKDGAFLGTWVPIGYDKDDSNHLVPNEYADTVRKIFHWYANEKLSLRGIATRIESLGIPLRHGAEWYPEVVRRILLNRVYLGEIHYGRKEKIVVKDAHPAIIDHELFEQVQQMLQSKVKEKAPIKERLQPRNPLAGLLRCSRCGKAMVLRESHGIFRYECRIRNCRMVRSTKFEIVEQLVLEALKTIREEFTATLDNLRFEEVVPVTEPVAEFQAIDKQISVLTKQLSSLEDLLEQRAYSIEKYKERSNILTDRIKTLNEQKFLIQQEYEEKIKKQEATEKLIPAIDNLLEYYKYATIEQKNMLLKQTIAAIIYDRPRLPEKWMNDDQPPTLEIHLKDFS